MVELLKEDIQTREVFDWKGLHLMHAQVSSCSQKLRIYLNVKGLEYTSRLIDIPAGENYGAWYMGINPRGLVPTLVHDGTVIIESNDILAYLEEQFAQPRLIPADLANATLNALAEEDDLHLNLRALSARYLFPPQAATKGEDAMAAYSTHGSGTVGGVEDTRRQVEQSYFRDVKTDGGISEDRTRQAVARFETAFTKLESQ
ncbi:MAG: glutathione S-transferase N-terminal domain-containing protein, partial [Pseudomonadota bacterium]